MVELLVFGALLFAAFVVLSVLGSVFALLGGLIALPFVLLRWALKLVGFLLALPFILVFGLLGVLMFGAGAVFFLLIPALPFVLIALFFWWLLRRRRPAGATS